MPDFAIEDYSSEYYVQKEGVVPAVRGGKFVQIRNGSKEYLVLSPAGLCKYHANIVERFCTRNAIPGRFTKTDKSHYEFSEPGWEVVGGGKWLVDDDEKSFRIYGSSLGYGDFDRRGLEDRLLAVDAISGYDIRVIS